MRAISCTLFLVIIFANTSKCFAAEKEIRMFDAREQKWKAGHTGALSSASTLPPFIPPGSVVHVDGAFEVVVETSVPEITIAYYHPNHIGSKEVVSGRTGSLIEEDQYYPFGSRRGNTPATPAVMDDYDFAQKERDPESSLSYFEARYNAGGVARFTTVDPEAETPTEAWLTNPQRHNAYVFAIGNPVVYCDPDGRRAVVQGDEIVSVTDDDDHNIYETDANGNEMRIGSLNDQEEVKRRFDVAQKNEEKLYFSRKLEKYEARYAKLKGDDLKGSVGLSKYGQIGIRSAFGEFDYWAKTLSDDTIYLIDDVAYDPKAAGNYLWAQTVAILGVSRDNARRGAFANNLVLGPLQNVLDGGFKFEHLGWKDDPSDQAAHDAAYEAVRLKQPRINKLEQLFKDK